MIWHVTDIQARRSGRGCPAFQALFPGYANHDRTSQATLRFLAARMACENSRFEGPGSCIPISKPMGDRSGSISFPNRTYTILSIVLICIRSLCLKVKTSDMQSAANRQITAVSAAMQFVTLPRWCAGIQTGGVRTHDAAAQ
jgi:hypothetical protein